MAQPWRVRLYATEPTSTFLVGTHSLILIVGTSRESLSFNENSLHTTFPHISPFARDRTQDSLAEGKVKIDEVLSTWQDLKVTDRSLMWNTDLIESLELR